MPLLTSQLAIRHLSTFLSILNSFVISWVGGSAWVCVLFAGSTVPKQSMENGSNTFLRGLG